MKKRVLSVLLTTAMVIGVMAGCGSADSISDTKSTDAESSSGSEEIEGLLKQGTLQVAIDDSQAPVSFRDDDTNELVGFDIDCLNAIGDYLGLEVEYVPTTFDGLIIGLTSGKYDVVAGAVYATEERGKQVDFADSFYSMDQVICVPKGDTSIETPADLAGKVIGVESGAAAVDAVKAIEGVNESDIREYTRIPDALLDISSGRIDCVVTESLMASYYAKNQDIDILLDEPLDSIPTSICVNKKCPEVTEKVNEAIKALVDDGTFTKYSEKWFDEDIIKYSPKNN